MTAPHPTTQPGDALRLYRLTPLARVTCAAFAALVAGLRAAAMIGALRRGQEGPLLAFPLTVILPCLLIALLLAMPPATSREGGLMRAGTLVQLILIIALPGFALYLALGFPVVFLAVELFETRLPPALRHPVSRWVVQ